MARPKQKIILTPEPKELLENIARSRESKHSLVQRAKIVLKAAAGLNNKTIAQDLGLCEETVGKWRKRWCEETKELEKLAGKPKKLRKAIEKLFKDKPRSGSPEKFKAEQLCQIIALACEKPPEYLSHWTRKELKREIINRGIAEEISETSIGDFLKSGRVKTPSKQILA